MKKIIYASLILFTGLQSCKKDVNWVTEDYTSGTHEVPSGPYVADNSFKIVAYYAEANELDSIAVEKYKMITHLHYAFAYPNADGTIKAIAKPANLAKVMQRAKENGVKRAISFSGTETIYSAVAADPVLRSKLVRNIIDLALKYDLDGIDIDWEYPRSNLSNDITYEAFMKELSAGLHTYHKYLSAAATAGVYAGGVRDGINKAAIDATDFINLMAYDGANWAGDPNHSSYKLAEDVLNVWLNQKGLPKEKAVLGFPAYGKDTGSPAKSMTYRNLLLRGASPEQNSYTVEGVLYYYNGVPLVKSKATLAKTSANGMMVWEFYQDANGANSLLKAVNDALGRAY
ncbi:chitinase [Pedobacter hiemivivus]|uniref:chitinase n=1 Tax=Pedobacter hiemivivus TaxID=2530454 RepID=A0A4V5PC97_9SPHI|nr:glycosyl hydrolase family 18 protein [Pedobacter hiemivivus]TKC55966.1 chitinase [Pedobacter hiemivivus]